LISFLRVPDTPPERDLPVIDPDRKTAIGV